MHETITDSDVRRQPTDAFIAETRSRFPTEREVDVILSCKMQRRNSPSFQAVLLNDRVWCSPLGFELRPQDRPAPNWL